MRNWLPCCCTSAPLNPAPSTRWSMMFLASVIWLLLGVTWFFVTACRVMVVPLDRSRPSPTLKLSCHLEGFAMFPRSIPASIAMMITARTMSRRPGREVVVDGATCRQSFR